jgi:hypothetical protein
MIATAFTDLCSNELWEEICWLQDQPATDENVASYNAMMREIDTRIQRRQNLEDNFAWG